ncbi:5359_t:CDS:1, partial [Racocetra fulgida]
MVSHAKNNKRLSDSLTIIKGRILGGSIDILDKFESQNLLQFYNLRNIIDQEKAFCYESFPDTFFGPKSENSILNSDSLDLLVAFYNDTVEGFQFTKPKQISEIEQISVFPNVIQYEQLKLGSEIFGSTFSACYIKSSRIL